jgi:hypothetical protein
LIIAAWSVKRIIGKQHRPSCTQLSTLKLIEAVSAEDREVVERLAKTERILNGRVDYYFLEEGETRKWGKWTALHECIRKDKNDMMAILLDHGANANIKDVDGESALFVASTSGNPAVVKLLLQAGADPNFVAKAGWSCLMLATRDGECEVTKALLEAGANLIARDMFGRNAKDLIDTMVTGQGIRIKNDESYDHALVRYRRVHDLFRDFLD